MRLSRGKAQEKSIRLKGGNLHSGGNTADHKPAQEIGKSVGPAVVVVLYRITAVSSV